MRTAARLESGLLLLRSAMLPLLLSIAVGLRAQQPAVPTQIYKDGVLYGKVVDLAGKPIAGAVVAIQNPKGQVTAWGSTGANGRYALAADPIDVLELRPARHRGLFESCIRAVGDVVLAPVKIVGNAVANPGKTAAAGAVAVADGNPTPLAIQAAAGLTSVGSSAETESEAKDLAARTAVGLTGSSAPPDKPAKGQTELLVAAKGYKDARVTASAFWMEPPIADTNRPIGIQAWLETVKMAPTADKGFSTVVGQTLMLSDATVSRR